MASIKAHFSLAVLRSALRHFSSTIRLVAFQAIRPIVLASLSEEASSPLGTITQELDLWKECFRFAIKADGKEYRSSLLHCLTSFIDRISNEEAALNEGTLRISDSGNRSFAPVTLPVLHSFVVDFLIRNVVVQKAAYPGSVAEKETFSIELLECILSFVSRDFGVANKAMISKSGAVYDRRRRDSENLTAKTVIEALLENEVVAALFSLLHSMWDGIRSSALHLLFRLILAAQANKLGVAPELLSARNRRGMEARAIYLASSPRQREADTGARILAFLTASLGEESDREKYMDKYIALLEERLAAMKEMLGVLLLGKLGSRSGGGTRLPLAHGIIHSLRLIVEHNAVVSTHSQTLLSANMNGSYKKMAAMFCWAIQISLSVVADIKEGSLIDGMDENFVMSNETVGDSVESATPLNVNTGAIGANGTFSSVKVADSDQQTRRIAVQRVVVSRVPKEYLFNLLFSTFLLSNVAILQSWEDGFMAPDERDVRSTC